MGRRLIFTVLAATLAATVLPALAQSFSLVDLPAGADFGRATGVSLDGATVVGTMAYPGFPAPYAAFTWRRDSGRVDIGYPTPGAPNYLTGMAVSNDGRSVAGTSGFSGSIRAFRQTGTGPVEELPRLPNHQRHYGRAMSGDGSVIVGYSEFGSSSMSDGQAWRWTESGGTQSLGVMRPGTNFSIANAISNDGRVIVGRSDLGNIGEAFRWTESGGFEPLAFLSNTLEIRAGEAHGASADGSIVVGFSNTGEPIPGNRYSHAVLWNAQGEIRDLGTLPAYRHSVAKETNADGSVIGGIVYNAFDLSLPDQQAMVWTEATGMLLLSDYLSSFGVSVPDNYYLRTLEGISGDGRTFVGLAVPTSGPSVPFVATIPAPGSVVVIGVLAVLRRRR